MNSFKDYMKKNGFRLGLVVVIVAVIFGFSASRSPDGTSGLENAAASITTPVKEGSTGIKGWLEGIYGYMFRYDKLASENEQLKVQLAESEKKLREAEEAESENTRLHELLNLREKHEDFVFESANIIDRPASNWSVTYTLSKGTESGIKVGNCVIDSKYNLVGQVTEVGSGWSTVRSVIDADIRVGALVGEGGNAAMIVGDFALMQKGETKLSYLTEETQVIEGDTLITSGKGGAFPKGLDIGTVTSVQTEAGGQVEYAVVKPASELGALSEVFVIKDFNIIE